MVFGEKEWERCSDPCGRPHVKLAILFLSMKLFHTDTRGTKAFHENRLGYQIYYTNKNLKYLVL